MASVRSPPSSRAAASSIPSASSTTAASGFPYGGAPSTPSAAVSGTSSTGFPYGGGSTSTPFSSVSKPAAPEPPRPAPPVPAAPTAAPPPPPPPTSTPSSSSLFPPSASLVIPQSPTTTATSPTSVDDVVAKAREAIEAAKRRSAQFQARLGDDSALSPTGPANPFGGSPVRDTLSPAPSAPSTSNPFGGGGGGGSPFLGSPPKSSSSFLATSPPKSDPFATSPSPFGGGAAPKAGGEEDEVEAAMRRLKQQELDLGIPDFRNGAGQGRGDERVVVGGGPAPGSVSVVGGEGGVEREKENVGSAFEIARRREREARERELKERERPRIERGRSSFDKGRPPPPPVPTKPKIMRAESRSGANGGGAGWEEDEVVKAAKKAREAAMKLVREGKFGTAPPVPVREEKPTVSQGLEKGQSVKELVGGGFNPFGGQPSSKAEVEMGRASVVEGGAKVGSVRDLAKSGFNPFGPQPKGVERDEVGGVGRGSRTTVVEGGAKTGSVRDMAKSGFNPFGPRPSRFDEGEEQKSDVSVGQATPPPPPPAIGAGGIPPPPPPPPPPPGSGPGSPLPSARSSVTGGGSLKNALAAKVKPVEGIEGTGQSSSTHVPTPVRAPSPPAPIQTTGGPPPPPPPPPPVGIATTTPYVRGSALPSESASTASGSKSKPKPADIGAVGPNLFALGAGSGGVKSVGKVSDRIKGLQMGVGGVFGQPAVETPKAVEREEPKWREERKKSVDSGGWKPPLPSAPSPRKKSWEAGGGVVGAGKKEEEGWEVVEREEGSVSPVHVERGRSGEDVFADFGAKSPITASVPAIAINDAPQGLYTVRAVYKFEALKDDDLALEVGEVASVEREEGAWLFGRVVEGGRVGWFPGSFVEKFDASAPPPALEHEGPKFIAHAEALWDYTAARDDELSLVAGERVGVISKPEKEWWNVENAKGVKGLVPATYLMEEIEGASTPIPKSSRADLGPKSGMGISKSVTFSSHLSAQTSPNEYEVSSDEEGSNVSSNASTSITTSTSSTKRGERRRHTVGNEGRPSLNSLGMESGNVGAGSEGGGGRGALTAWTNKVDPRLLERIPGDERKRQEAIFELIGTEQSYVRDLQLIVEVFYAPLQTLLQPSDVKSLFSNLEEILLVNSLILSDLETVQSEQEFVISGIGGMFLKHAQSLDAYQRYCANMNHAQKTLQRLRAGDPRLAEFLKSQQSQNPACRFLDLSSFLLEPMQRITRYTLLLRQILHHTPKDHPDHNDVVHALAVSEEVAERVNLAAREQESREKIAEIKQGLDLEGEQLDLFSKTRFLGVRVFLGEGWVQKSKSGRKLHLYLFNDLVLLGQSKGKSERGEVLYRKPLPLNEIAVRDRSSSHVKASDITSIDDATFQIVHGEEVITLRAPSVKEKRKWMNLLEENIQRCYEAQRAGREKDKSGRRQSGTYETIGTLQVLVCEARVGGGGVGDKGKLDIYAALQLNRQKLNTRTVSVPSHAMVASGGAANVKWNQALMFSVVSLDEVLKIAVYNFDRYSQDDYLGQAEIALDFLEYYGGRETERINLELKDVRGGSVVVQLAYRPSL
ncbi:hypothetical protein HK097_008351 [Rhizophlyctis rosea]|uniref:RhoGEF domain containing protein n=1 Tax=Rhizophlyctis rosea TaxID=64517 RepID=A0AAD5X3Z5_9FUNG|nr:hypothetical protein HK097_008351 [Rhizophlyctis rosea]